MGVTLNKKKPALPDDAPVTGEAEFTQLIDPAVIDEYLQLEAKIKKHDAKVEDDRARMEALKKQIVGTVDELLAADEEVTLKGHTEKGKIEISERRNQTILTDLPLAKKFMGTETFLKVAKIGVSDLKDYLTPEQRDQVTKTERTGARTFKVK